MTDRAWVPRIGPEHIRPGLLNVVVYGPGEGESVVLVMPDGHLGVVDGCWHGVDDPVNEFVGSWLAEKLPRRQPKRMIRFLCLTHPHSDHFGGLALVVAKHRKRLERVATIQTTIHERAAEWFGSLVEPGPTERHKYNDFKRFILRLREVAQRGEQFEFHYLTDRRSVFEDNGLGFEVFGCAPSGTDAFLAESAGSVGTPGYDYNTASAALVVRYGGSGVLLTGDLVGKTKYTNRGWLAAARHLAGMPLQVIKAAHHASEEAHCERLWHNRQASVVLVTPFKNARPANGGAGGDQPPTRDDLVRLAAHTPNLVVTSPPRWLADTERKTAGLTSLLAPARPDPTIPPVAPTTAHQHRYNAVLVALDNQGVVHAITLAGQARFYDNNGLPQPLPTTPPVALGVTPAQGTPAQSNPAQSSP